MGNNDNHPGMSGGVPAGCICGQRFPMCEDDHAVNCPASAQYEAWVKMHTPSPMFPTPTPPIEGRDADVERVAQVILKEAREEGADSPVDYGDAEQIARAVLQALGERG